jgi:hypothetical protein
MPRTESARVTARRRVPLRPMRRNGHRTTLLCLAALVAAGCGGSAADDARKAAESYVRDVGNGDGRAVCGRMTRALQRQAAQVLVRANPQVRGRDCASLMDQALGSIPASQLRRFASADIEAVKVDGSHGSFVYRLGQTKVPGEVAKENGDWKVSCCLLGRR